MVEGGVVRPSWEDYYVDLARLVARRSTCPRRRVGAVMVKNQRLIATGYNGAVRGAPHCDEVGCLMEDGHCVRAVHAELNAIIQCAWEGVSSRGASVYTTDFPCVTCAKAMIQAGVERVVYLAPYPDRHSARILQEAHIQLLRAQARPDGGYQIEEEATAEHDDKPQGA